MPLDIYNHLTSNLVGSPELERTYKLMVTTPIDFVGEPWGDFPEACDLCQWLMCMDPRQRCQSAAEALQHPWFNGLAHQMEAKAERDAARVDANRIGNVKALIRLALKSRRRG